MEDEDDTAKDEFVRLVIGGGKFDDFNFDGADVDADVGTVDMSGSSSLVVPSSSS